MEIVCLDLEGVLVPEIWIEFSRATGIPEFARTTRDEPDYDKLMRYRIDLLAKHGLGLAEIQSVIARIDPMEGAREFLDALRERTQVAILSDTFAEFAKPLMKKLGWPTLLCNTLVATPEGKVTGYKMRCAKSKLATVRAFQSCGLDTIAAGDSFNDLHSRPSVPLCGRSGKNQRKWKRRAWLLFRTYPGKAGSWQSGCPV